MLIVSTTGATNINDEHSGTDGVFDVPAELAEHLLQFPGWRVATEEEASAQATPPSELKGGALEAALTEAGLPKTGTADEKRASLMPPPELKGEALEAALAEAGLPKTGTADEKRAALAALAEIK